MSISRKIATAAVAATVIAGAGAFAWAEDAGSGASPAGGSAGAGAAGGPRTVIPGRARLGGGVLGRVEHGDLIVRTRNGFQPVTMDRGQVTAASATSITVQRPDGQAVTVAIDAATKFRGVASAADLQTGKPAVVLSHDGKALLVAQRDPDRAGGAPRNGASAKAQSSPLDDLSA